MDRHPVLDSQAVPAVLAVRVRRIRSHRLSLQRRVNLGSAAVPVGACPVVRGQAAGPRRAPRCQVRRFLNHLSRRLRRLFREVHRVRRRLQEAVAEVAQMGRSVRRGPAASRVRRPEVAVLRVRRVHQRRHLDLGRPRHRRRRDRVRVAALTW